MSDEETGALCDEAFRALAEKHARFVFRVAYAAVRNAPDAEDVAQEVFLKLYRTGAWRRMKDERAYLARAAWRAAAERRGEGAFDVPLDEDSVAKEKTPEQAALDANWTLVVRRLIDTLPEDLRAPLALSAMEELTSEEIARLLGIPDGTVRRRIMRAREMLKEKLTRLTGERA